MQNFAILPQIRITMQQQQALTVQASINAPIEKTWQYWTEPSHIKQWNNASEDWHTTNVTNDLRAGGSFVSRMEAKDGSVGFDFSGTYDVVELHNTIAYTLGDGRKVTIKFTAWGNQTTVEETFEAETTNAPEDAASRLASHTK